MSGSARLLVDATRDAHARVTYRVRAENPGDAPFTRTLPTSKSVDVEVRTASGRIVHAFGADMMFLQVLTDLTLQPGEARVLVEESFTAPAEPVTVEATLPGRGPRVAARVTV